VGRKREKGKARTMDDQLWWLDTSAYYFKLRFPGMARAVEQ
jgi:hypothetical protein